MASSSLTPGEAAGIGFASSAINTLAKGETRRQDIKNTGEASRTNIGYAKNDYLVRSNIAYEQQKAIQREVGDIMSQRGLEALQAEGRLRTAGASTGLSGSGIDEIVAQVGYSELLDNQVTIARGRSNIVDTFRSRLAASMDMKAVNIRATQETKNNIMSSQQVMIESLSAGIQAGTLAIQLGGLPGGSYAKKANEFDQFDEAGYNSIYN